MNLKSTKRRSKSRSRTSKIQVLRLCREDSNGNPRWMTADLLDHSSTGIGVSLALPLSVGTEIAVNGKWLDGNGSESSTRSAHVAWCLEKSDGTYRAGLQFQVSASSASPEESWSRPTPEPAPKELDDDHYEVLQVSPNAHPDTIHRVYRMLAQRYHPDNSDTGDEEYFKKVLSAYRVLNDPMLRAAYDTRRLADQRIRWRIFENPESAHGVAGEKRKRDGILSVLYTKRLHEPERPYMPIQELEDLLGVPRDHLHVSLWYLSEKALIRRDDRGRYEITVDGVDEAERNSLPESRIRAMLSAPDADAARPS